MTDGTWLPQPHQDVLSDRMAVGEFSFHRPFHKGVRPLWKGEGSRGRWKDRMGWEREK